MPARLEIPVIALGLVLIVGAVLRTEARPDVSARGAQLVWLVGIALALVGYFREGDIVPGDGHSHLARTFLTLDVIRSGSAPTWSNRWYMGYPLDLHYGPLYYVLAAAFAWVGGVFFGTKVLLFVLHVASALAMSGYAQRRYRNPALAMLLGTAYAISGFHYVFVRGSGYLPLSIVFLTLPLVFGVLEQVTSEPFRLRSASYAAILLAIGLVTHLQYGAYVILAYFVALGVGAVGSAHHRAIARHAAVTMLSLLILTAWFTVPLIAERSLFVLGNERLVSQSPAEDVARSLLHLVLWSREWKEWNSAYIGLSLVVLAVVGLVRVLRTRHEVIGEASAVMASDGPARYPIAVAALGLCGMFARQPRMVLLLFFAIVVLAGDGYVALTRHVTRGLATVLLLVTLIDLGAMLHQPPLAPYVPPIVTPPASAGQAPARVLTLYRDRRTWWPSLDVFAGTSSPMGGIPQLAPKSSYGYTCSILTLSARELIDDRAEASPATVALLRLLNVGEVVIPPVARRVSIPSPAPVVFAASLDVAGPDEQLESLGMAAREAFERRAIPTEFVLQVAARMGLVHGRPLAERVLVPGPSTPPRAAHTNTSSGPVEFELFDFAETHDRVSFRYRADRPGYLRLAYSYFPETRVTVDRRDATIWPDALGATIIEASEGEHSVDVEFGRSPLRTALFAGSLAAAFGMFFAVRREQRRGRSATPAS